MQTKKYIIFWSIIAGVVALMVALDMLTKALFTDQFYPLINGVLSIFFTLNTGGAWSILSEHTWLLILMSILIMALFFVFCLFYKHKNKFFAIGAGLIFGGAIGNLIDRIAFGAVRDFIKLDFIEFPIFNIADCSLTIGAILICIYFLFFASKNEKNEPVIHHNP